MDKKFNLKSNTLYPGAATNAPVLAPTAFKKLSKTFRWKNGKEFTYASPVAATPIAWPWVLTGGYVNTNGSTPTDGRIRVFWKSVLKYTDA